MITSAKNYTKKTPKKPARQNPGTKGKSKAIQRKSYKEVYTYTLRKREKGKMYILYIYIYIYILKRGREQPVNKQIYQ